MDKVTIDQYYSVMPRQGYKSIITSYGLYQ